MTPESRTALLITNGAASGGATNGATLRVQEVADLLTDTGHRVTHRGLVEPAPESRYDLVVLVSYVCAARVRSLRPLARRVWLDAVDSWVLVDASGVRAGHLGYVLRAGRDALRLARMPAVDLLTYISLSDLQHDRGTVRAVDRRVLPGAGAPQALLAPGSERRVVLAGDWSYPPNRDGLRWFRDRVLPRLEQRLGPRRWHVAVYGAGAESVQSRRVLVHGHVGDPRALYRAGDVHAAPVRFGGGVKRKVLQPLAAGLPVVTTPAGAHGLAPQPGLEVHVEPDAFANAVARLLEQEPSQDGPRAVQYDRDDTAVVRDWLRR